LLSGKYEPGHRFPADDVRSRIPGEYIDRVLHAVQALNTSDASLLAMALQFQLAHPGVSTVTVGMKTGRQVQENVNALLEPINDNAFNNFMAE
jgi:aryl-alcohol dehydrogenase-like predicted oxidoreductase